MLPDDTVLVLDFFHALEHLAEHARARFGAKSKAGGAWYRKAKAALLGKRDYQRKKQTKRKGHKKGIRPARRTKTIRLSNHEHGAGEALARTLLAEGDVGAANDSHDALVHYIGVNADRMDYPRYLPETAQAILNLRLLRLVGGWDDFWAGPDITQRLGHSFAGQSEQKAAA